MDYALAKELKKGGFPIRPYPAWALAEDDPTAEAEYFENYIPTLGELIKACGDQFHTLGKSANDKGDVVWWAAEWNGPFSRLRS
jgi:hypothetical protein